MKPGYEKEFMNIQSGLISLCLEAVSISSTRVSKVYAYGYIGDGTSFFNMFFESNGSILPSHKVINDEKLIFQVLRYGTKDLEKLRKICVDYETTCPIEMKMCYDCITKKYIADYNYEIEDKNTFSCHDSFLEWRNEIEHL